jgi:hypothetical protein
MILRNKKSFIIDWIYFTNFKILILGSLKTRYEYNFSQARYTIAQPIKFLEIFASKLR